jgi:hypothetical protein
VNSWPQNLWFLLIGFLCEVGIAWWLAKRWFQKKQRPEPKTWVLVLSSLVIGLALTFSTATAWYYLRPQPAPVTQTLFEGITYVREVRKVPRRVVIHVVTVDLKMAGLGFLVTPGKAGEKHPLTARTTSEFAREFQVQLAMNGDFFSPWYSNAPWDFYPRSGDAVTVHGIAASRGTLYTEGERKWDAPTLYLSKENRPALIRPTNEIYNAISGNIFLMREGKRGPEPVPERNTLEPRSAIGFDKEGTKLFLVAVDGRQPWYSEGMDYDELIQVMVDHGAYSAINLDGGGSTALVVESRPGEWRQLNCPIHTRIPGRERPSGNHLGVFLKRGGNASSP